MLWAGNVLKPAPTAFVGHPDSLIDANVATKNVKAMEKKKVRVGKITAFGVRSQHKRLDATRES